MSDLAEIRLAILDGNMQCAEQLIRASFPAFVEARADVLFHLAIQAFVERTRHEMSSCVRIALTAFQWQPGDDDAMCAVLDHAAALQRSLAGLQDPPASCRETLDVCRQTEFLRTSHVT